MTARPDDLPEVPGGPAPDESAATQEPPQKPMTLKAAIQAARERLSTSNRPSQTEEPATDTVSTGPAETPAAADEEQVGLETVSTAVETEEATADTEGQEPGTEETPGPIVVQLPGRRPGEVFEIEVDSQEAAERLNQLRNGYMNGQQVREARAEIERAQHELEDVISLMETDPVGFIVQHLPEETQDKIAFFLLTNPAVWERVRDRVAQLEDPDGFRIAQAEARAERLEMRERFRQIKAAREEARQNARELIGAIEKMIPEIIDGERREQLIRDARQDLREYVARHNVDRIEISDLPLILQARLRLNGIDPIAAARALHEPTNRQRAGTTPRPGPTGPANGQPPTAQRTAEQLIKAAAKKRAVAAVAPAGAGAPIANRAPLPRGHTLKERLALARERGLSALLGR